MSYTCKESCEDLQRTVKCLSLMLVPSAGFFWGSPFEQQSKLLVFPIVIPYIIPYMTALKEFTFCVIWAQILYGFRPGGHPGVF